MKARMRAAEVLLWLTAAVLLGLCAFVYLERNLYQAVQSWAFDRALQASPPAHGLGSAPGRAAAPMPAGAPIGRIEIPRVGVRAMIVNGTAASTLRRAVGHIEGTPLFGGGGNVALAAHRDTFFRGLRNIRRGDTIEIDTLQGVYKYVVDGTEIVGPNDTRVLAASARPTLTLVTCYPFNAIGPAPRRFIVQARMVEPHAGGAIKPRPSRGS